MARIYRTSDRIKVKIDDTVVTIRPLTYHQKAEIQSHFLGFTQGDVTKATEAMVSAIKYAVTGIEGIEDCDGRPYELEFDCDALSEDCVSDLLNIEISDKLQQVCSSLLHGIPKGFVDNSGKPIEGVEIVKKVKSDPNS